MSSYQVLARKWRPMCFADVKGQDHVVRTIKNSILNNRLAHAYIFSGSRGIGKTSVARILAKAVCCEDPSDGEPCNKCRSCLEIISSSSIDVQEIDGASNNGVDSIRELRENIVYPPVSMKYKIYIIDEVHMLSNSAFNALLKTLEEPPPHGLFIFATTEPHKIPQTIVSRCQHFDFKKLGLEDIYQTLVSIVKQEDVEASSHALYSIAREARGSLRDSLSILDQVISFTGKKLEISDVKTILGFVDRSFVYEIARAIINNNPGECLKYCRTLFNEAYDEKRVIDTLVEIFRDLVFVSNGISGLLENELPDHEISELKQLVSGFSS
ncbi:MAG: DNA polymerase III subunit gamma/tau, partial [Oligoflexia bacterium]|nr:DNA polymerase III subunit gamma/tau [Oligoflexia bacterium]